MSLAKHYEMTLRTIADAGVKRLALMGAGQFASRLAGCLVDTAGITIVSILDDDPAK